MKEIPFSVYDFFAYLASGVATLFVIDDAFALRLLSRSFTAAEVVVLLVAAYTVGHIVAHLSSALLEHLVVRRLLGRTEATPFVGGASWRASLFPRLFTTLPPATQERIRHHAPDGVREPGAALFNHSFAVVKRDPVAFARMNTFLTLYGFARNLCFVGIIALAVYTPPLLHSLIVGDAVDWSSVVRVLLAGLVAVMMFYRYAYFYWRYSFELYVTFAELPSGSDGLTTTP